MQIHIEAHLIQDINTSVSEFVMKMFPPLTSRHDLLLSSCGQRRMESLGPKLSCRAVSKMSDEGGSVLVGIEKLTQLENVVYSLSF